MYAIVKSTENNIMQSREGLVVDRLMQCQVSRRFRKVLLLSGDETKVGSPYVNDARQGYSKRRDQR